MGLLMKNKIFSLLATLLCLWPSALLAKSPTDPTSFKILFVGDTSFGENYQERLAREGGENILKEKGYDYPLAELKKILLSSNLVIANLETPLTKLKKSPYEGKKEYLHFSDPQKAPATLKKYNVGVVSLANNHGLDFGLEGLKQSLQALKKHGIAPAGVGMNEDQATTPYRREIKIENQVFKLVVISAFEYRKKYDDQYEFYAKEKKGGVARFSVGKVSKQIKQIKATEPAAFVVVYVHWGKNYRWKNAKQTRGAHRLIDAGADLVVGHGAHQMQEVEEYRKRWILYGLGNFMFNSPGRYQQKKAPPYSLVAQLILQEKDDRLEKTLKLYPILTDNKKTKYQSRFLRQQEFKDAFWLLLNKRPITNQWEEFLFAIAQVKGPRPLPFFKGLQIGKDEIGPHIQIALTP